MSHAVVLCVLLVDFLELLQVRLAPKSKPLGIIVAVCFRLGALPDIQPTASKFSKHAG